jgi:hypothetical protein
MSTNGSTTHMRQMLEREIILTLLEVDRPHDWTVAALEATLGKVGDLSLRDCVDELACRDVVVVEDERVRPSAATRRLEQLDLLSV